MIPYRLDPANGYELKYAIRSMVKHFKDMTGVLLIGDRPTWYQGEHIHAQDYRGYPSRKEYSMVQKILLCPYEDFLLTQDDVFAMRDFDSTLPNYYSGTLAEVKVHGRYHRRVRAVMGIYPEGMFYDIHCPMVINRDKFREANNVDWLTTEFLQKSLYGNFIGGGSQMADCKIRNAPEPGQPLVIPDAPFFSTDDQSGTHKLINFDTLYPDASQYEK